MSKRIFLAFDPPGETRKKLKKYYESDQNLHWTKLENLHMTLLFLGQVEEEMIEQVLTTTQELAQRHPPMKVEITSVVPYKTMVWARVKVEPKIRSLYEDLESSFALLEMTAFARHSFKPHFCLARSRKEVTPVIYEPRDVENINFLATHIVVFESLLGSSFPVYESLDAFELSKNSI